MADRETLHLCLVDGQADVASSAFVRSRECLDDARDLARMLRPGTAIALIHDDGTAWRGRVKRRERVTGEATHREKGKER